MSNAPGLEDLSGGTGGHSASGADNLGRTEELPPIGGCGFSMTMPVSWAILSPSVLLGDRGMASSSKKSSLDESAIIESLYEAALQPDLLPNALHEYARALNGSIGHALTLGGDGSRLVVSRDGQEGAQAYARQWWRHDIATQRGQSRRLKGSVNTFDLTSPEERASLAFYQEFAKEFDCFWSCAHIFHRPGAMPLAVGVRRPEHHGPFGPVELERLDRLGRHVARAIDIATRLEAAAAMHDGLCQALTRVGFGVVGISGTGRVLFVNEATQALRCDGLMVSNGALLASMTSRQTELDGLISGTLSLVAGATAEPPRPVSLPRPSGRRPLVVYGFPVSARQDALTMSLGGPLQAMLVIIEPDGERTLDERLLQQMFALTPAEARVAAAVARGKSPRQAASAFGISEGSLRIQLKRVFHKVGVSRQSELALLLAPLLTRPPSGGSSTD
jgi:DNA-binding CsgD family transcriptional regulator